MTLPVKSDKLEKVNSSQAKKTRRLKMKKGFYIIILSALACLLAACWTKPTNPRVDPYEGFNRGVYNFNHGFDVVIAKPLAKIYKHATPPFLQKGVRNAFNNLNALVSFPNDLVQGKINYSLIDLTRFLINLTIGIGGLFDPASHMGLPAHYNDYGLTFAYYADNKESPYLMLPIIGPSTFRNAAAMPLYIISYPPTYFSTIAAWSIYGVKYASIRADLLDTDQLVEEAFDPYVAVRNAYLQRRDALIRRNDTEGDYNPNKPPHEQESVNIKPQPGTDIGKPIQSDQYLGCDAPESNETCVRQLPAKIREPETHAKPSRRAL